MEFSAALALWNLTGSACIGELVAMHRKVHLFDIDIPGKIKFKVRDNLYSLALVLMVLNLRRARH